MTIFNFINDILFKKRGDLLDNIDSESEYNPYMVNRWISMYSPDCATIINNTANWLYPIFESKTEQYKFLVDILPSRGRKRITYFKKNKPDFKSSHANIISILATNLELSKREINDYIETGIIDISKLKKCYE